MFNGELNAAVHGVWVRSTRTDDFGRIAYLVYDRNYDGHEEAFVMWEGDGKFSKSGSYHDFEELNVRPYKPRPWFTNKRIPLLVQYGSLEME